jgi:hypothetical protein
MFGIFYFPSNFLPIAIEVLKHEKFILLCKSFDVEWAHLIDKETGIVIATFKKNV